MNVFFLLIILYPDPFGTVAKCTTMDSHYLHKVYPSVYAFCRNRLTS